MSMGKHRMQIRRLYDNESQPMIAIVATNDYL